MTQFWRLKEPESSDYRHTFVNGEVRAALALPDTGCRTCAYRRSSGRVLSVDCPPEWQSRLTPRRGHDHRVTNAEFAQLRQEITPVLGSLPKSLGDVEPGDRFQPLLLRIPSRPVADFLWPSVGDILVSERVKILCEDEGITGVVFSRVEYERVGRRPPHAKLRNRGGEPADALRRLSPHVEASGLGSYFHCTVTQESNLPHGVDPNSIYPECQRATLFRSSDRRFDFAPSMWRGADVCFLATTLHVIITDRLKQALDKLEATNVSYRAADEGLDTVAAT